MLTSATPVTPHKPAAWLILRERLLELAEACDGLTADAPEVLARVRQQLATFAARLGRHGAVGQEPQADVPARTIQPPAQMGTGPVAQTRSLVFLKDGRLAALMDGAQERTPGIVVPLGGGGRRSSH
jgi:hypothetical protein